MTGEERRAIDDMMREEIACQFIQLRDIQQGMKFRMRLLFAAYVVTTAAFIVCVLMIG
jgi:hypothetical protein